MSTASLSRSVAEYLALRRALGFKLRHETWFLPDFVAFLAAHRSPFITTDLALRWAQQPSGASASWWAHRLGAIRCFAKHHRGLDPRTEVPPPDLIPCRTRRRRPHIYTDEEIASLMLAARRLPGAVRADSYATLIGLLAVTGMRVSEAIALDEADLDWPRSLLTVRHAKFQKSRHVPLHESALAALRAYAARRDRLLPRRRSQSFFVSGVGARIHLQNFHRVFLGLVKTADFDLGTGPRPRIHDLRHSFAAKTLRDWYRGGLDAERRLFSLSTYLGHASPTTTYWYLTATPDLLALASRRVRRPEEVRP